MNVVKRIALAYRLARAAVTGKINVEPSNIGTYMLTELSKHLLTENTLLKKENVELHTRVERLTLDVLSLKTGSPYRDVKPS